MPPKLTLTKDNKEKNRFTILLSLLIATLLFPSFLSLVSASSHVLSISPSSRSFGSVTVGSNSTQTFTIRNSGSARFTGNVSGLGGAFSCTGGCSYNLEGGSSQTVSVRFSPSSATSYSDTANFSISSGSNDSCSATLAVPINGVCGSEGNSVPPPSGSSICAVGSSAGSYRIYLAEELWTGVDYWSPFWEWSCEGSGGGTTDWCLARADTGCGCNGYECGFNTKLFESDPNNCGGTGYPTTWYLIWGNGFNWDIAEWVCLDPIWGSYGWCFAQHFTS